MIGSGLSAHPVRDSPPVLPMLRAVRPVLRDLVAETTARLGVSDPARWAVDCLSVVTFHRVLPSARRAAYPLPGLAVTPEELAWYLDYFTANFTCGSLTAIFRKWVDGDRPRRPFLAVTFDDGQLDNFEHARPVLERAGVRASFFVPSALIDQREPIWHDALGFAALWALERPGGRQTLLEMLGRGGKSSPAPGDDPAALPELIINAAKHRSPSERQTWIAEVQQIAGCSAVPDWAGLMDWDQIAELAGAGHEIGSHSMTHPLLPQCSDEEIEREIAGSKRAIEARLGMNVDSFCYPNGDCDNRALRAVEHAGYACAVTTTWGVNERGAEKFRLRRCDMHAGHTKNRGGRLSAAHLAFRMSGPLSRPGVRTP